MKNKVSKIKLALKIVITVGIFALIFQRVDLDTLKDYEYNLDYEAWTVALILLLGQFLLLSWRWMILINIGLFRMNYPLSLQVTLASNIANLLLIPTVAGMVVRVGVALQMGTTLFKALFATGIDRVMTLTALSILCAIFLPAMAHFTEAHYYKEIAIFVCISLLIVFVALPIISLILLPKLPERLISKAHMRSGVRYLTLLFNNHALLAKTIFISLVAQLCFFMAVYCIAASTGITLSFLQMMVVLPAISLVSAIPLSFGGWGIREGAFIYGLGLLGVATEVAFSTSVQIGLLGILATIIAGLPALISGKLFRYQKTK